MGKQEPGLDVVDFRIIVDELIQRVEHGLDKTLTDTRVDRLVNGKHSKFFVSKKKRRNRREQSFHRVSKHQTALRSNLQSAPIVI